MRCLGRYGNCWRNLFLEEKTTFFNFLSIEHIKLMHTTLGGCRHIYLENLSNDSLTPDHQSFHCTIEVVKWLLPYFLLTIITFHYFRTTYFGLHETFVKIYTRTLILTQFLCHTQYLNIMFALKRNNTMNDNSEVSWY